MSPLRKPLPVPRSQIERTRSRQAPPARDRHQARGQYCRNAGETSRLFHLLIRLETPSDIADVRRIHERAFGRPDEARLVDALRSEGSLAFAFVAKDLGRVVGHIVFSKMHAPFRALGLAPIAVLPEHQRRGFGSALIREGLNHARIEGWEAVFVVGEPAYYERFGFDARRAQGFTSPYAGPYLMVLPLAGNLPAVGGSIDYPPPFAVFD
jgi:putative acetyltransferase